MHNVSISGGSEKTTYNGSLGYTKQNGLTDEIDYSRFNARMNLTSDINKYLTVGMNASGYRGVSQDAWNGFINVFQGVSVSIRQIRSTMRMVHSTILVKIIRWLYREESLVLPSNTQQELNLTTSLPSTSCRN